MVEYIERIFNCRIRKIKEVMIWDVNYKEGTALICRYAQQVEHCLGKEKPSK